MKPFVFAYNRHSKSAKMLAKELNAVLSYPNKGDAPLERQPVINWGSSFEAPWLWQVGKILNHPNAVKKAVNKLSTFKALERAGIECLPEYTKDPIVALQWINNRDVVYCRELLTGRKGEGLDVYDLNNQKNRKPNVMDLERFKLFTKGFKSHWEFKVHVINGKVDHVIRVGRDEDFAQNPYVRNHNNGWTFYDEGRDIHPDIKAVCVAGVAALGLDFGIVDIGVGKGLGEMCIYEINTAPGGETGDAKFYANAFKKEYGIQKGA